MALPKTPLLAVDCVVFNRDRHVLLIRRKNPPFKGHLALPGGFVGIGETVESAARRELREETGITAGKLTLVGVYSEPDRDPRGHVCTVAFLTRAMQGRAAAGDDAASIEWASNMHGLKLAFDHSKIISDALKLS